MCDVFGVRTKKGSFYFLFKKKGQFVTLIVCDRLSQAKQNKVYLPEEPFPHAHLIKSGRLKHYKHIYDEGFSTDFRQVIIVSRLK